MLSAVHAVNAQSAAVAQARTFRFFAKHLA